MKIIFSKAASKVYNLGSLIAGLLVFLPCSAHSLSWVTDTIAYGIGEKLYINLPPDTKKQDEAVVDYRMITYKWGYGIVELSEGLVNFKTNAPNGSEWNYLRPQCLSKEDDRPAIRWAQNDTIYMIEISGYEPFNIFGAVLMEDKESLFHILGSIVSTPPDYDFCTTIPPFSFLNNKINQLVNGRKEGVWVTQENEYLKVECYSCGNLISVCMYSIWKGKIRQLSSMATYNDGIPNSITFWSNNGIPTLIITAITKDKNTAILLGIAQQYEPNSGHIQSFDIEIKNADLAKFQYSIL